MKYKRFWGYMALTAFTGFLGLHRFASRKSWTGLLYLFTFGLLGMGPLYDGVMLAAGRFRGKNGDEVPSPLSEKPFAGAMLGSPALLLVLVLSALLGAQRLGLWAASVKVTASPVLESTATAPAVTVDRSPEGGIPLLPEPSATLSPSPSPSPSPTPSPPLSPSPSPAAPRASSHAPAHTPSPTPTPTPALRFTAFVFGTPAPTGSETVTLHFDETSRTGADIGHNWKFTVGANGRRLDLDDTEVFHLNPSEDLRLTFTATEDDAGIDDTASVLNVIPVSALPDDGMPRQYALVVTVHEDNDDSNPYAKWRFIIYIKRD